MGTNYYAEIDKCSQCGRAKEKIHLGKNSFGWAFTIQANNYQYYKNWEEMKRWLKDKDIYNEYGELELLKDFIKMVEDKKHIKDPEYVDYNRYEMQMKIIDGYKFYNCEFS